MHRLIVVGGGAGGLELATQLGDRFGAKRTHQQMNITLLDRNPTHVWKPLLHEVAAGSMDPHSHQLDYAAQAYLHGFRFKQGALSGIDRTRKIIFVDPVHDNDGLELWPARIFQYDTLVIAVGSTTHFFGVAGAEEHALALDTVEQAECFRRRLITAAMGAGSTAAAERPRKINIAIVGGGATGVELAAKLRSTADVLSVYGLQHLHPYEDIGITLIESGPRVLPALSERVSKAVAQILVQRSVNIMSGEHVVEVTAKSLRTRSGKAVSADIAVWAAGIKAPAVLSKLDGLNVSVAGQLFVRQTLQTDGDDNIFALGDCACCPISDTGRTVPPRAQAAHQQASFLVKAISRRLSGRDILGFQYRDLGSFVSLGHDSAVGSGLASGSLFIGGLLARVMYKSLYRMHVAALHGWPRMLLNTLSHRLRRTTAPHVKLH